MSDKGKYINEDEGTGACNACKQCAPLGACVAFRGIEGCLPMMHGSQGCATYIRRYLISHFREPVDIASSNFSEETTIFGGNRNFNTGISNIISQYSPKVIAIASTCLAETIGEDVQRLIYEYRATALLPSFGDIPEMLFASTPSYGGTHYEGFHQAVYATVKALANAGAISKDCQQLNLFSNFISPEDIRHLKEIVSDLGVETMLFPDYSETLDGVSWDKYQRIAEGGTTIEALKNCGNAQTSIELGIIIPVKQSAGEYLQSEFAVTLRRTGLPVGIQETDKFFNILKNLPNKNNSQLSILNSQFKKYERQRGRLIDLYIDGHKYVSDRKVVIYGEEDLVVALAAFTSEIGMKAVICASGGESGKLRETLKTTLGELFWDSTVAGEGMTFDQMETEIERLEQKPDLLLGNSKGYYLARKFDIPLVRVGFPIHDRIGAAHNRILCYEGTRLLFEEIVNTLLEEKQRKSPTGYNYM
jgi:nitrogenase molybdenum-iron protein NifN